MNNKKRSKQTRGSQPLSDIKKSNPKAPLVINKKNEPKKHHDAPKKRHSSKQVLTTVERLEASMTPQELKEYKQDYRDFILSELLIAITTEEDDLSVRKLAKEAGVSPTIIQAMRSGQESNYSLKTFFKVLSALKCKKITITTRQNKQIDIDIDSFLPQS